MGVLRLNFTFQVTHPSISSNTTLRIAEQTQTFAGGESPYQHLPLVPDTDQVGYGTWAPDTLPTNWLAGCFLSGTASALDRSFSVGGGLTGLQARDIEGGVLISSIPINSGFHVCHIDYVTMRTGGTGGPDVLLTQEDLEAGFDREFLFTNLSAVSESGAQQILELRDVWLEWFDSLEPVTTPYLRMTQRDDGAGITKHSRFTGNPTAQQESLRIHGSNTYV